MTPAATFPGSPTRIDYVMVQRRLARLETHHLLVRAHLTPVDWVRAARLIRDHVGDIDIRLVSRPVRGRAGRSKVTGRYRVTLPARPGATWGTLRLGLVLHELSHVLVHQADGKWQGHGARFCDVFSRVLRAEVQEDQ